MAKNLIVILGPTASGKTEIAAKLASDLKGEIISADSRQVYRGMDIGTGKDLSQYIADGKNVPYHMIDIIDPGDEFNVFEFQKSFYEIFRQICRRGKLPVLCGGTGLYLQAILSGYNMPYAPAQPELRKELEEKSPEELRAMLFAFKTKLHNKTDMEDKSRLIRAIEIERARNAESIEREKRPVIDAAVFGIKRERKLLRERITERLEERLKEGMIEEVKKLYDSGLTWKRLDSFGLEYRYIAQYLQNNLSFDEMKSRLSTAIHQFAKRQETWFRQMEKKGIEIEWIQAGEYELLKERVERLFSSRV